MMSSSLLLAGAWFAATNAVLHPYEAVEPHMGTLFRIKLYAANQADAQHAFAAAFARVGKLDRTLSDYKPDSELNRLSQLAVRNPIHVSDDLFRVLAASQQLSEKTGGAFDITVGPLTHLWREARKKGRVPSSAEIKQTQVKCGYRKLRIDPVAQSVEFAEEGMQLDAGAIAKGDAADQALLTIGRCGIRSALVAASGDLAFSDAPPGEAGWKIGVDSLDSAQARFPKTLVLSNAAVSTSGSTEQHLDAGGVRYSHIIDPQSGLGITRDITVSVIAPKGIEADSLATAVSVLGAERGLSFIEQQPGASAVILVNESSRPKLLESARFQTLRTLP